MKSTIAAVARLDLGEHGLQPLLELAAVLRAGEQRADVERPDLAVLQALRARRPRRSLREPFGDRGLADAGLADQHRVVLRAAREDLDDAADLLVAADHRVELPRLGGLGEVAAELRERLVGALGILRRDALTAADLLDPREDLVARHRLEREEEVLGRDVVVLEPRALLVGLVEHARERRRRVRLLRAALHRRQGRDLAARPRPQLLPVGEELLVEQREQQVVGRHLGVAAPARESCAAATASWLLIVSLWKSMCPLRSLRRWSAAGR